MRRIYVISTDIIHSKTCHIHFMYGEPNSSLRHAFWEQQCQQSNAPLDEPVFFIGDFNALLGTEDKNGGLEVDDSDFSNLRNFCFIFNLHDPGFSGPRFTWSNMQQGPDLILERLYRCLINQAAEDLCPKLCVNNLPRDSSDHCPMHIGFNYEDICIPRPFHFMAMWMEDPTCLRDWNKNSFGNIQTNISTIRKELAEVQISNPTDTSTTSRLKARLEYLYNLEELYWEDKSREVLLMEGDRNSPYFHRVTLFRTKRNDISWIKDSSNTILTERDSIGTSFINYFKNLYSSHPQQFQDEILIDLPIEFSVEDYSLLNLPRTVEKIKNVVFQMGMVLQRSIYDNILLANEAIFVVNHNDKTEGIVAIKLDMSKTYDKLECPTGFFQPERGLRQGDPLSPYLYIICSEALSSYIDSLQKKVILEGIKVCKDAPEMTHLLFVDDSLLFSKANIQDFQVIKDYLQKYCLASGQEINFDKSGILFSRKIPEHMKALLANILEIKSRDLGEKYLGTPTVFQASKIQTHMGILQAVDARISIWLHKLLSQAAITTLIKHIGQTIPLFQMRAFCIPKHLCKQMDSHLCKFWWGETLDPKDRKLHLLG
ncbi:uncharacterized protein LOC113294858 [Papaver somniferum]|uniref:uncharacterized protein LOC113294858 n=1 Tax=Papaver somniferum TaxID=3469 RepID=UPI000E6F7DFB|nr:uncharacterized protein LOC113294858 [Papaver somniferum]